MKNKQFDYEDVFMGVRGKKPATYFRTFREDYRLRSLVAMIKLGKGKLLDIGCGGGMLTESLPYYFPKASIFGCDISKTAIKYAAKFGSGKVKYSQIQNNKFPYKDSSFDVCISLDVLEHVPDVDFFLKEAKRVLKKKGKFFLIVPCEGQPLTYTWFFQKAHLGESLTYRYLGHIHPEFTHKKVISLLRKHGFSIQEKAYSEHILYQLLQFLILFLPKILLEIFLGKNKANEYTNASLVKAPKNKNDYLLAVRNLWYKVWDFMMFYPMNWETMMFRKFSTTAWKLHVLVKNYER